MKNLPKYLVAKYVSDPRRMEPRNIGVVLWASGRVAARFLESDEAEFVGDKKTYARWIDYWRGLLAGRKYRRCPRPTRPPALADLP